MNNIKGKLYLDFDGTIVNSVKRICKMYNDDFKNCRTFKSSRWYMVDTWNFTDECPLADKNKIDDYFNEKRFFDINLEFMENAEEIINKLNNHFDIYVISMGNTENLLYKEEWLKYNLPCVKEFIGCNFNEVTDKAHKDLSDGILIDDSTNNLETSNAKLKILYGDIYSWNKNWNGIRKFNWYEVYDFLMN